MGHGAIGERSLQGALPTRKDGCKLGNLEVWGNDALGREALGKVHSQPFQAHARTQGRTLPQDIMRTTYKECCRLWEGLRFNSKQWLGETLLLAVAASRGSQEMGEEDDGTNSHRQTLNLKS